MKVDLFVYGTLMYSAVWSRIVGTEYPALSASVCGFERRRVSGADYPGLIHGEGEVEGRLYLGVNAVDLERLDRFEGEYYRRIPVTVESDGAKRDAQLYLFRNRYRSLLQGQHWEAARFERGGLQRFGSRYLGFRRIR